MFSGSAAPGCGISLRSTRSLRGSRRLRAIRTLSSRVPFDRLGSFTGTSTIWAEEPHPLVTGERLDLFRREAVLVQEELDRLFSGPVPPRFLHLDMHLGNVKILGDRLAILDF